MSTPARTPPPVITQGWIEEIAAGKSFVDIGGLWGTINERVSDAHRGGAARLTLADIAPAGHEFWARSRARLDELGVGEVQFVSTDILAVDAVEKIGLHDIVHCSGVIYHVADPVALVQRLRKLSTEYVLLVSIVVPEKMETDEGSLTLEGGTSLFIPGLDPYQLRVAQAYCRQVGLNVPSIADWENTTWVGDNGRVLYGPWWWLFTPSYLRRMLEVCGLEVVNDATVRGGRTHGFLCRVPQ